MEIQKNDENYFCKKCNYLTSRKHHFDKHLFTAKYKKGANGNENRVKKGKKGAKNSNCNYMRMQ